MFIILLFYTPAITLLGEEIIGKNTFVWNCLLLNFVHSRIGFFSDLRPSAHNFLPPTKCWVVLKHFNTKFYLHFLEISFCLLYQLSSPCSVKCKLYYLFNFPISCFTNIPIPYVKHPWRHCSTLWWTQNFCNSLYLGHCHVWACQFLYPSENHKQWCSLSSIKISPHRRIRTCLQK